MAMPEATVNQDHGTVAWQNYIGFSGKFAVM
jgi:hypothetical protein